MGTLTLESTLYALRLPDRAIPLSGEAAVGRDPEAAISLHSPAVSRHHARFLIEPGGVCLEDLGSANGTYVDGRRLSPGEGVRLSGGERLRFADVEARLESSAGEAERARCGSPAFPVEAGEADEPGGTRERRRAMRLDVRAVEQCVSRRGRPVRLLEGIEFTVLPGELLAVIGPSGAGKTTLMRILSGMCAPAAGEVLLNGVTLFDHLDEFRGSIGYVPQEDIVHRELTVHQVLQYAARLRLPRDSGPEEIRRAIDAVLYELDLEHRRHAVVGTLSGGERKRINIAVELLTRPSLLLLDEPTSGLDPGLELRVVALIRRLTDEGRTVLFVTHATESIAGCDRVLFLTRDGRVAFFGTPGDALEFFGVKDFTEAYLRPNEEEGWPERYRESTYGCRSELGARTPDPAELEPAAAWRGPGPLQQLAILSQRYAAVLRGDPRHLLILLAQAPFIAAILALIYRTDTFTSHAATKPGGVPAVYKAPELLFLLVIAALWFGAVNAAREVSKERAIFERERLFNLRIGAYLLSKAWILGLLCLVQGVLLLGIVALRVPFNVTPEAGLGLVATLFLTGLAATLQGLFISSAARSSDQAMSLVPLLLLPQVIFSGLLVGLDDLGPLRFVANLVPGRWGLGGLTALTGLPELFLKAGLAARAKAVFDTAPGNALAALAIISAVSLFGASAALAARETERGRR